MMVNREEMTPQKLYTSTIMIRPRLRQARSGSLQAAVFMGDREIEFPLPSFGWIHTVVERVEFDTCLQHRYAVVAPVFLGVGEIHSIIGEIVIALPSIGNGSISFGETPYGTAVFDSEETLEIVDERRSRSLIE